jgi:RNA polymerase sigma factor (TIGR02999 family)
MTDAPDVTQLLIAWGQGDRGALERLLPLVYAELRRIARQRLRRERREHTLCPTALVHEAYLRLSRQNAPWQNRAQFFALASEVMRRVLVDHARRRAARGGGHVSLALDESAAVQGPRELDLLALDAALDDLATLDPRAARLVELRFFGGLDHAEAAGVLGISRATAERDWAFARAWLRARLDSTFPSGLARA